MEAHLQDDISPQDVAVQACVSPFFLQRGFSLMTGVGIGEYLRNRRLYEAALALRSADEKVIDIALRYGYDTPESFTKAFARFHGATPSQVRSGQASIRAFLPLTIKLTIQGGDRMDFRIASMFGFKVIGFQREFSSFFNIRRGLALEKAVAVSGIRYAGHAHDGLVDARATAQLWCRTRKRAARRCIRPAVMEIARKKEPLLGVSGD